MNTFKIKSRHAFKFIQSEILLFRRDWKGKLNTPYEKL